MTGETRALNFWNQMYVMGGGRTAPNPSNEVDIYDPVANIWSVGTPFTNARRNFPTDTNGTDNIWLAGGYDCDGVTLGLDGNLRLPGESLWVAFAYTHGDDNSNRDTNLNTPDLLRLQEKLLRRARVPHLRLGRNASLGYAGLSGDSRSNSRVPALLSQSALSSKHWPIRHR